MRAAVIRKIGEEKVEILDNVGIADTGPGQVRIRIKATGVCHSDLSVTNGTIPQATPCVLGHEGAGEIVEVGEGVTDLQAGDHAIVCWNPPCGKCVACLNGHPNVCTAVSMTQGYMPRFEVDGMPAFGGMGCGTFAEEAVIPVQAAVKIPQDVPFDVASLIGCGVMTGVGAVINTAKVKAGSSVVVFGCGGVGIATIQGARLAGAAEIVAIDPVESKRELAQKFGATHAFAPDEIFEAIGAVTGGVGFDYAFEAVGLPSTIRGAYDAVCRGGTAVIVGAGKSDQKVEFNAFELFFMEKKLMGSFYGSADVRVDFAKMIRLWRAGRLDLESMITQRLGLDGINQAFDDMKAGRVVRTLIEL